MDAARAQAAALLPGVPVAEVSAHTGAGLEDLRVALAEMAAEVRKARAAEGDDEDDPVLHIDRVFTIRGAGTVVTGTLRSGSIRRGDRLRILPRGVDARARRIETHGREVAQAVAGRRVAVNLAGLRRAEVERGDVLTSVEASVSATYRLDVGLSLEPQAGAIEGTRVQVHHGTRDAPARVVGLGAELVQLRLEAPLFAQAGERVVIRKIAPPDTIGGALIIDPAPRRHGRAVAAEQSYDPSPGEHGQSRAKARARDGGGGGESIGRRERLRLGSISLRVLAALRADGDAPRGRQALAEDLGVEREVVERALDNLVASTRAVRIKPDIYYPAERLAEIRERVVQLAESRGEVTLREVRDKLNTSRKYAQALLEDLDAVGVTVRHGDVHVIRRPG
jgi:selenocysteine-specific elongation factor